MRAKPGAQLATLTALCRDEWRGRIEKRYVPRICACLRQLSEEEIWWRPNPASNSIGNLVLHLCGNMRQWIVSGLGGVPDIRKREREFAEKGPVPRKKLIRELHSTANECSRAISHLSHESLLRHYTIQGFEVTGYAAVEDVVAHLAYHAGQILYITKLKQAADLEFTKLPRARAASRSIHSAG